MYFFIKIAPCVAFSIFATKLPFWEIFGRKLLWHLVLDFAYSSRYVPWNALSICMPDDLIILFI